MNVLFLCPSRYLSFHFMNGWKNAFHALGIGFRHLDCEKEDPNDYIRNNEVDLLMTSSGEGISKVDAAELNSRKIAVVIAGLPYNHSNSSFDPHCPLADPDEVRHIASIDRKIIWSQHEPLFNDYFYQGYKELGIDVLYLPYCADTTTISLHDKTKTEYDFFFVGGLAHKKKGNLETLKQILERLPQERIKIYGDKAWTKLFGIPVSFTGENENWIRYYQTSAISPNFHIYRQKNKKLLVNDRTFHIPVYGGFQICDNPLARKFFDSNELVIAENEEEFIELFFHYLARPEERFRIIENGLKRVMKDHSYFNRIATIFEVFSINRKIVVQDEIKKSIRFPLPDGESFSDGEKLFYRMETQFYNLARSAKNTAKRFLKR